MSRRFHIYQIRAILSTVIIFHKRYQRVKTSRGLVQDYPWTTLPAPPRPVLSYSPVLWWWCSTAGSWAAVRLAVPPRPVECLTQNHRWERRHLEWEWVLTFHHHARAACALLRRWSRQGCAPDECYQLRPVHWSRRNLQRRNLQGRHRHVVHESENG